MYVAGMSPDNKTVPRPIAEDDKLAEPSTDELLARVAPEVEVLLSSMPPPALDAEPKNVERA